MRAPVIAGGEWPMQEAHENEVANQLDPESCDGAGNRTGEASTGAHSGRPSRLSRAKHTKSAKKIRQECL